MGAPYQAIANKVNFQPQGFALDQFTLEPVVEPIDLLKVQSQRSLKPT
ncbi:MAG TPA: hypothetical protein V6C57_07680 [Coleofasciculaceae cyanobacterium]